MRPGWIGIAAVAAISVAVGTTVWATGGAARSLATPRHPVSACPAAYAKKAPWVPSQQASRSRLAPRQTPSSALICAYAGSNNAEKLSGWTLSGQRQVRGGLDRLAAELTAQPSGTSRICDLVGGAQTNYLLQLTYTNRKVSWVTVTDEPNHCVDSGNGAFRSNGSAGIDAARAFRSGRWPERAPTTCTGTLSGRLGQDSAMVPAGPVTLTVCTGKKRRTFTSGYGRLVTALNRLPVLPSTNTCGPTPTSVYRLLFTYPAGPPVTIFASKGCIPEVDNVSLQSHSSATILPLIEELLRS